MVGSIIPSAIEEEKFDRIEMIDLDRDVLI